ncbi:hypothetical protein ACWEKM_35835 [Streptomyces sp. NPDC004752]
MNADTYGVVGSPGFPGTDGAGPYTRQTAEQLRRNPDRPTAPRLHALTVAAATPGALVLPAALQIEAHDDEEQQPAPRPMSNVQRMLAGYTSFLPVRRRARRRSRRDSKPCGPHPRPHELLRTRTRHRLRSRYRVHRHRPSPLLRHRSGSSRTYRRNPRRSAGQRRAQ